MRYTLLVLTMLLPILGSSQNKYDQVWMCGQEGIKATFNTPITTTGYTFNNDTYYHGGHSNICDANGNLKLLCNGFFVHNAQGAIIANGDSITPREIIKKYPGLNILSQSSIFLPMPNNKYYLFTPTASDYEILTYWNVPTSGRALYDMLLVHEIDMNANGGAGAVTKKGKILLENVKLSKTNMMACRHGNGTDWWLFKQAHDTNMVYKFLLTKDSIYNMGVQGFAQPRFGKWDIRGQAAFSKDGEQYAVSIQGGGLTLATVGPGVVPPGKFFVANFDRCSGELYNPRVYQTKPNSCQDPWDTTCKENSINGICFSPNGRFLYIASESSIKQLDLQDSDTSTQWSYIHGIDTSWNQFQNYSTIYAGPDNKLYIGNWNGLSKQMSVINNPDAKGAACNFCARCLRFPDYGVGTPPCMPNYRLGAKPCWPASNEHVTEPMSQLEVYPNPAANKFQIQNAKYQSIKELYNSVGQLVLRTKENEIDVSHLGRGIYFLHCSSQVVKVVVE